MKGEHQILEKENLAFARFVLFAAGKFPAGSVSFTVKPSSCRCGQVTHAIYDGRAAA